MVGLEDRDGPIATNVQQGFVQHFILPLWETMASLHPELQHFVDNAAKNSQILLKRKEKAVEAAAKKGDCNAGEK